MIEVAGVVGGVGRIEVVADDGVAGAQITCNRIFKFLILKYS